VESESLIADDNEPLLDGVDVATSIPASVGAVTWSSLWRYCKINLFDDDRHVCEHLNLWIIILNIQISNLINISLGSEIRR